MVFVDQQTLYHPTESKLCPRELSAFDSCDVVAELGATIRQKTNALGYV